MVAERPQLRASWIAEREACERCGRHPDPRSAHQCWPIRSRLPKIQGHLVEPYKEEAFAPLRRYRGAVPFGRMKAVYNFLCAGMELEIPTVSKLSWASNELGYTSDLAHWAGLHAYATAPRAFNALGTRLLKNPGVMRQTPHLQEYLEFLRAEGGLKVVNLSPLLVRRPDNGIEVIQQWPFIPGADRNALAPDAGMDLINEVDALVPRGLPKEARSDVCQDLVVAVLLGDVKKENLRDAMPRLLKKAFGMYPSKYRGLSLESTIGGDPDGRTLGETLHRKDDSLGLCDDCEAFSEELQDGICPRCFTALESRLRNRDAVMLDYVSRPHKRHGPHRGGDAADLFEPADEAEGGEPVLVTRGKMSKSAPASDLQRYVVLPTFQKRGQHGSPGADYFYTTKNPKRLSPKGDEWKEYPGDDGMEDA